MAATTRTDIDTDVQLLKLSSSDAANFDRDQFTDLLADPHLNIEAADKDGMTALMHCAYRGNNEACSLLLQKGADVNSTTQESGYSALMFATIAGHKDTVLTLLQAGAKRSTVNNMGKNVLQLGSFVGQHGCVQVISNYFSLSDLEEYTKPQGVDQKPRLQASSIPYLHKLLTTTHIHPVKILQIFDAMPSFQENYKDMIKVLESIGKRMITDQNDSFALKVHYLSYLIQQFHDQGMQALMKRLLHVSDDGKAVEMDRFLRQCLRQFPFLQSAVLKQLVATLAKIEPGNHPTALSLFTSAIIGEKAESEEEDSCSTCGTPRTDLKKCSKCKRVRYCSVDCQKLAWTTGNHKKLCKKWAPVGDLSPHATVQS